MLLDRLFLSCSVVFVTKNMGIWSVWVSGDHVGRAWLMPIILGICGFASLRDIGTMPWIPEANLVIFSTKMSRFGGDFEIRDFVFFPPEFWVISSKKYHDSGGIQDVALESGGLSANIQNLWVKDIRNPPDAVATSWISPEFGYFSTKKLSWFVSGVRKIANFVIPPCTSESIFDEKISRFIMVGRMIAAFAIPVESGLFSSKILRLAADSWSRCLVGPAVVKFANTRNIGG